MEKKNHNQVSAFFRKIMKDDSKDTERKSAIFKILYLKIVLCILSKNLLLIQFLNLNIFILRNMNFNYIYQIKKHEFQLHLPN